MSIYVRNLARSIAILHSVARRAGITATGYKGILYAPRFRRLVLHAEKYLDNIVSRRSLSLAALTFAKPRFFDSSERRGEPPAAGKMGVVFVEHMGGVRQYSCQRCDTNLTNRDQLLSTRFTGGTGRAYLFQKVVNVKYSGLQDRVMLTGRHIVRDVSCKNCNTKLGWMYEYAHEKKEEYKEGKIILEKALILESVVMPGEAAAQNRNQDQAQ